MYVNGVEGKPVRSGNTSLYHTMVASICAAADVVIVLLRIMYICGSHGFITLIKRRLLLMFLFDINPNHVCIILVRRSLW